MTPVLHPFLVNDPFGDPALYVDFKFAKRAALFDLGDLHSLCARKILRLSDVFVSHTHVDHFIGFDQVLRVLLGRNLRVRMVGPAGFLDAVERRLGSYAWNLVDRYATDLRFQVTEVLSDDRVRVALLRLQNRFVRESEAEEPLVDGVVFEDPVIRVRATVLDHGIPCLAYAVQETLHVNVWKNRLQDMGLQVGPWLRDLKEAVIHGDPDDTPIRVRSRQRAAARKDVLPLGLLKQNVLRIVPGQKIAYVVDAAFTEENVRRIARLARDADYLFIEACFAHDEAERAAIRRHLTTTQAGYIARLAGVRRVEPFHFSPRHAGEEVRLRREVEAAFAGAVDAPSAPVHTKFSVRRGKTSVS